MHANILRPAFPLLFPRLFIRSPVAQVGVFGSRCDGREQPTRYLFETTLKKIAGLNSAITTYVIKNKMSICDLFISINICEKDSQEEISQKA